MRIIYFQTGDGKRKVARVNADELCALGGISSTYELAFTALKERRPILLVPQRVSDTQRYQSGTRPKRLRESVPDGLMAGKPQPGEIGIQPE